MTLNSIKKKTLNENWQMITKQEYLDKIEAGEELNISEVGNNSLPVDIVLGNYEKNNEWVVKDVQIPNCWESDGFWKGFCGPVWYRNKFNIEDKFLDENKRYLLQFGAVSYFCSVWINGERLGEHRGMWDSFQFDITDYLQKENIIILEIHKPGDYFPVKNSLAGFVPFVTTTFGGIWQDCKIVEVDKITIEDIHIIPDIKKDKIEVRLEINSIMEDIFRAEIDAGVAESSLTKSVDINVGKNGYIFCIEINDPILWSPDNPYLYNIDIDIRGENKLYANISKKFGMRDVSVKGKQIYLNNKPHYLRGVLNWVSYPDIIAPHPSKERIKDEIIKMKNMGYNMIKLCLVIPNKEYFELADELGVLLWVELPMWMPRVDEGFAERAKREYERIIKEVRNYPSVVMYTLGCELDDEIGAGLLEELYHLVKEQTLSSLVKDNSGSAEAYGGVNKEFADFYDYHFYAEANQFSDLIDYFYPKWKEEKPLVFGEYCDSDTFRDVREIEEKLGHKVWWRFDDPVINPQGVRWDYNVVNNVDRLKDFPLDINFDQVKQRSYGQTFEYRKDIIEQTRKRDDTSGYTITDIIDTSISTAGMMDDFGKLKFDPDKFSQFNNDTVITFEKDKRRIWKNGGDRPQYLDEFNNYQGDKFRVNILCSHYGDTIQQSILEWKLIDSNGEILANNNICIQNNIRSGFVGKIAEIEADLPVGEEAYSVRLDVNLIQNETLISNNSWNYWLLPEVKISEWDFTLWDKRGFFADMIEKDPNGDVVNDKIKIITNPDDYSSIEGEIIVATAWNNNIKKWLNNGTLVYLMLDIGDTKFVEGSPFWREGIELIHSHQLTDKLPHSGYPGIQFKGITPEVIIDKSELESRLDINLNPVISRLDARTFLTSYYMLDGSNSKGKLVATTLKLAGGFARQPLGFTKNILGAYLLDNGIQYLKQ